MKSKTTKKNGPASSIDYDALMRATKPRTPGGGFGAPRTMTNSKSPVKGLKTPNLNAIKQMTRQEKIELLNQLNTISPSASPSKLGGTTSKKNLRSSSNAGSLAKFTTPAKKSDPTKMRPTSATVPAIVPLKTAPAPDACGFDAGPKQLLV